ncbi:MAG TPA: 5-oxoprolinase subunit PxpA [Chitinophagaceae bacterium]|nr:5-oxoprolinase subunit PxpA [Chitinophagaceae bacterium]
MISVDINCDMGEGLANDEMLMRFITSANIACGYHAGDTETMQKTIALAIKYKVKIGAHPGFEDKENFGRTKMKLSEKEIYDLVTKQLEEMQRQVHLQKAKLHHVKAHGALYNMAAKDVVIAGSIAKAVADFDKTLMLYGLSNSEMISEGKRAGLKTVSEAFADRSYQSDGTLTPRSEPDAIIKNEREAVEQALRMVQEQVVISTEGRFVNIDAETICIHGDGKYAVEFARALRDVFLRQAIRVEAPR